MNIQQLEYIVALDTHRQFVKAAESCFVTQATLSMMVKKLEDELGIIIFDRSKQPILPTAIGQKIIDKARITLREINELRAIAKDDHTNLEGHIRIGIIPTLAPYLLPLFLEKYLKDYPKIKLSISELTTTTITERLIQDRIDIGILAIPLNNPALEEYPMFSEKLLGFVGPTEDKLLKNYIAPEDIDTERLLLLEEGHCLRSQMMNLCALQKKSTKYGNFEYEAGSIESLINITEINNGITIVPELATLHFSKARKNQLRTFIPPVPIREIGLVTSKYFYKQKFLKTIESCIKESVQPHLQAIDSEILKVNP